jgi:NAD(P)H-quinone oxidoreductase subunit K
LQPTHRYYTIPHQMKWVEPIVTGAYLRAETQKAALAAPAGLPLSVAASPAAITAEPQIAEPQAPAPLP